MSKILIVDPTPYQSELKSLFLSEGYGIETCTTAFDAIARLASDDVALVIADVDLPGDNSFEFYYYLQKNYPFMPVIMLTEKPIDDFFDKIFTEGIGNVLSKPVTRNELAGLARKLITKNGIFGLDNYLPGIKNLKRIRINSSKQILPSINKILQQIVEWDFSIKNQTMLNLILNEMIINAIYHSHGLTQQKLERVPVKLEEGKYVDIHFGHNAERVGIAITDYNGKLTKTRILESMFTVVNQKKIIEEAFEKGEDISHIISETGRGLDLVRQIASEYYFILKKNERTDITLIFDRKMSVNSNAPTSMKIIEVS